MIVPPATIGVLGGGQLGRYTVVAARLMGYGTVVLDPDPAAPAGRVADEHLVAAYDDAAALNHLAARCAVVTTEFENPPAAAMSRLAEAVAVAPAAEAVAIAQDRIREKCFLAGLAVATAPFAVPGEGDAGVGFPAIVKTARLGYDGKGQRTVDSKEALDKALAELAVPCIVEGQVPLDVEISVIVARAADGTHVAYPLAENHHVDGILDLTVVPARVSPAIAAEAVAVAERIAAALDYVGVLAVEMFVSDGPLARQRARPAPAQQRALDVGRLRHESVRTAGPCRVRAGPRVDRHDLRRGGNGQPARRRVGGRRAAVGSGARRARCAAAPLRQDVPSTRPQDGPPHGPRQRPRRRRRPRPRPARRAQTVLTTLGIAQRSPDDTELAARR